MRFRLRLEEKRRQAAALQSARWRGRLVAATSGLLGSGDEFGGGGSGALLGPSFLFDVLGAVGNFVVEGFDFPGQVKVLRVL